MRGPRPYDQMTTTPVPLRHVFYRLWIESAVQSLRTDWADGDETYEQAVPEYAKHLLSAENPAFPTDFVTAIQPSLMPAWLTAWLQTVIKLTAPASRIFIRAAKRWISASSIPITAVSPITPC